MDMPVDEKLVARMAPELRELAREILPNLDVPDLSSERKIAYIAGVAAVVENERRKHAQNFLPPIPVSPQDEVRKELVARWLEPWARAIREEVFGSAEPPFSSLAEAAAWIERESEDARETAAAVARDLGKQVDAAVAAWLAVPVAVKHEFARMTFGPEEARLSYFGDNGRPRTRGTMGSAKLSRLAWGSVDIAETAGWNNPAQATTYLLLGVAAPMPHISVHTMVHVYGPRHAQANELRRHEAMLTIRGSDCSYDELREIWRRLRIRGITEKKPLKAHHAEAWKFVEKGRAAGKTWQQVLDEWNANPQHHYYKTIRGLQAAHRRAEEKGLMNGEFFEEGDSDTSAEGRS